MNAEYKTGYAAGFFDGYDRGWSEALQYEDGYEPDVDEEKPYLHKEEDYND